MIIIYPLIYTVYSITNNFNTISEKAAKINIQNPFVAELYMIIIEKCYNISH